jgi:hypothetical protein
MNKFIIIIIIFIILIILSYLPITDKYSCLLN